MRKKPQTLYNMFNGPLATMVSIVVFVGLAARTALTKVFPLPYDEAFHFGLIKLYTHHLSPLLAKQPAGADAFGAVARDPSYLYHYLMSFPLRLVQLFAHTTIEQVVSLRLLNIGLGIVTLLLVRRLARQLGASTAASNLAMLAMAITPAFYDLSGQINYDNLLIPLTLVVILATWQAADIIKRRQVPVTRLLLLAALLMLTSLVKYTFLPVMCAVVVYLAILLVQKRRRGRLFWNIHWKSWPTALAVAAVVVAGGLWAQRYGVNLIVYHTPHPQCNMVLSISDCSQYSPWYRNYLDQQTYASHPTHGLQLVNFSIYWLHSMYYTLYSTVYTKPGQVIFSTVKATLIAAGTMLLVVLAYFALRWHRVKGSIGIPWILLGLVMLFYCAALWGQNFSDFHHLGALVGIQGRYLLLVAPIAYALAARGYTLLIADIKAYRKRLFVTDWRTTFGNQTYRAEYQKPTPTIPVISLSKWSNGPLH